MGDFDWGNLWNDICDMAVSVGGKIILAILVLIIGTIIIKGILKGLRKSKLVSKLDPTVCKFLLSFAKIMLYVILVIAIISILGVPIASVITVLASAGVAVGLALQGALSNLAGGIMLLVFRPFKNGDFIEAAGHSGTVQEITMFYTILITPDNKKVTIPNGALMNASVVDYSTEDTRRVDLVFTCAKSENPQIITAMMQAVMAAEPKVLKDPEPFARVSGGSNEATEYTVRAWCKNADYWDVYFNITQGVVEAFGANGVAAPAIRIINETVSK